MILRYFFIYLFAIITPHINEPEAQLTDPCSCSNANNYLLNETFYFHEMIEISADPNQVWNMSEVTTGGIYDAVGDEILFPFIATESSIGSGIYQFEFWHKNEIGFCATYENDLGQQLENCNTCKLPNATLPNWIYNMGTYSCSDLSSIPPCPSTVEEVLSGPYGASIDNLECNDLFTVSCLDSALPLCNGMTQTITRFLRLDREDRAFVARYTYDVEPLSTAVTCDSVSRHVKLSAPTVIDPEILITSTDGFCSSNLSYTASQSNFDCSDLNGGFKNHGIPVTVTVTDDCGNHSSCEAKVTVMLKHLDQIYGQCMCTAIQEKHYYRNGIKYFHRMELISGVYTHDWNLINFGGTDVYNISGQKLSLPLAGQHIGCGFFFWEYWHTNNNEITAEYREENFGRIIIGK